MYISKMEDIQRTYNTPWPMVIITIVGSVYIVTTTIYPGISYNKRIFGSLMLFLLVTLFALVSYMFWRDNKETQDWTLAILGISVMSLFFIIFIAMDFGGIQQY